MIKAMAAGLLALTLAGCGAQGAPVAPGGTADDGTRPTANLGVGIGPNGVSPGVTLADGIGRVSLGPGGVRLGAAGIPLGLGL
ncbi:hypothetical protein ACOI1H_04325 [Loktanella sp. DJP18]|uniref:hypothetical protein n=1 Tax=Loktanella sp. DJP18 TaxID=3409788 RepID=UPI003BB70A1C